MVRPLGFPPPFLMSYVNSVLSKPSCKPSPPATINTRFVYDPLLESSFWKIHLQETAAVQDKIEILRSRIAALEKLFQKSAGDAAETRRREGLLMYVTDLHSNRMLRTS